MPDGHGNNTVVASSTTAPYSASWDTTTVSNGVHYFSAVMYMNGSPASVSASPISVDVENSLISIVSPANSSTVSGKSVALNIGPTSLNLSRVGYYYLAAPTNYPMLFSSHTNLMQAPWNTTFDSTKLPNGQYGIEVIAYDTAGRQYTSAVSTIIIKN
jgi:hypothetical protein